MEQVIDFNKIETNKNGDIVKKKKHSIKHSKDNALEENEKQEIFRVIKNLDMNQEIKYKQNSYF